MLKVNQVHKDYEGKPLLNGVTFEVKEGEVVCLLGASGSGKSTILRIIAGLEELESGQILWNGKDIRGMPAHLRDFGLMFQDYALFPHYNVAENVAFGLRMKDLPEVERQQRVDQFLGQVGLKGFERRKVTDLSGGEQQRVALARALAPLPRLLLFDEPLGALDRRLREDLLAEIHKLLDESGIPAIYVTHDQEEAFALADTLLLLHEGVIHQAGTPAQVYTRPRSLWAAGFLGLTNTLRGTVQSVDPPRIETQADSYSAILSREGRLKTGQVASLLIRPENVRVVGSDDPQADLIGVVTDQVFLNGFYQLEFHPQGEPEKQFLLTSAVPASLGESVGVAVPDENLLVYGEPE